MSRVALVAPAALVLALSGPTAALAAPTASDDRSPGKASADRGSRGAADDPAGNNGTIKVDGVPLGDGKGNEPHVDCAFALDFWGFDAGDVADIVFTGKPPTGPDRVLLAQSDVAISDDAAGGGQDADATLTYTAAMLGLTGEAPHRNGWHVKVTADVESAPGGAKSKVFWLQCPAPATTSSGTTSGSGGAVSGSTTGTVVGTTTGTTTGTQSVTAASAGTPATTTLGGGTSTAAAVAAEESAVAGAYAEVAAPLDAAPAAGALAATGGELATLVLLGLAAIGIGAAGVAAGRQSRTATA